MPSATTKRTYALDSPTVQQFEQVVRPGQRSKTIDHMIKEFLDQRKREMLRQEIIEGCHAMAETNLEIEQEFRLVDEEASRAFPP